jgi:hypothetical protein
LEWLVVDSTTGRAHQPAAGMNTGRQYRNPGRSAGGLTTKLYMTVDSLAYPVAMHLSPGQDHDSKHALEVIDNLRPEVPAMDKAFLLTREFGRYFRTDRFGLPSRFRKPSQ